MKILSVVQVGLDSERRPTTLVVVEYEGGRVGALWAYWPDGERWTFSCPCCMHGAPRANLAQILKNGLKSGLFERIVWGKGTENLDLFPENGLDYCRVLPADKFEEFRRKLDELYARQIASTGAG